MKVHPYLNFDGRAEEAFHFYRSVFGGEFISHMKMKDGPDSGNLSREDQDRTMHISLPIAKDTILMASDVIESSGQGLVTGNNMHIMLGPTSKEEADRLFGELSKDGDIEMHMEEQFWGDYFGSFTDKFGIKWMISYNGQKEDTLKELEEQLPDDISLSKTRAAPLS
ncbi:VOC family protein [Pricia sp.]|uniref:VOC family protein n=1 Tax=Pricia sp. TaxID=2268138 RepID=UPI003593B69A